VLRRLHRALLQVFGRLPRVVRRRIVRVVAPTFTVGSMCIIERADGAILLVRHSYRRRWGTPGGLCARREHPIDTARREVLEEVGLEIELVAEPTIVVDARVRRVDVVFRGRPALGADPDAVQPSSTEILECRWFTPDALPELQAETVQALRALARAAIAPPATPLLRLADRAAGD
jgi:8-oxo-dGTP pyrophosphatase MutT (NUDIX family)